MKKLRLILTTLLALSLTSGCIHKPDVQQGNVFTSQQVATLKRGMSKDRVRSIMGNPVLLDTFHPDHWYYVNTNQLGRDPMIIKSVVLYFQKDHLVKLEKHALA